MAGGAGPLYGGIRGLGQFPGAWKWPGPSEMAPLGKGGESLHPLDPVLAAAALGKEGVAGFGPRQFLEKGAPERCQPSTSQNPGSWRPLWSPSAPRDVLALIECWEQLFQDSGGIL